MNPTPQEAHAENLNQQASNWPLNGHHTVVQWDALLRQIANSLPAMIWMCGADGHATLFNQSWMEFTGYALPQALHRGWEAAVHPEDVKRRIDTQQEALQTRKPFAAEYRLRRSDGEYRWMLDQGAPQYGTKGEFRGIVGVAVDITDRKAAEEKLRWLSKAVEQSPATVLITDLNGRIEYVNPKFTQVSGYSPEEAIGQNPRILKSGEMSPEEYAKMWATLQKGEWQGEFHNKRKNGELYWETASICPIRDETGTPTHYIAVKEDITARKQMEAALRASEDRFRIAIEHADLTIYDVDPQTGQANIYGRDKLLNSLGNFEEWSRAIHPDDRERMMAAHHRRLKWPEGLTEEYRLVDREGNIQHYFDRGAPICDGRVMGVVRNITEDKRAEESLAQLAAIVECSVDAVMSFDAQGILRSWNPAAERLYGYSAAEILGQHASVLSPPDLREKAAANVSGVARGTHFKPYETRHMRKGGEIFPVSIVTSPIRDRVGNCIGGSGVIRNITDKKKAEESLKESENRFRALVKHSTDIITLVDPAGLILYDSPGILALLGVSAEQRLGREAFAWIHPDDRSYMRMLHDELLHESGTKLRAQVRLRHADGSWRWCDSWAANLLHEPGVRALVTSFRDITELKAVETALRDSEQRYRKLIEEASDAIFTIDLQGNVTSVNSTGERISGYGRQELLGMNMKQLVTPECLPAVRANIQQRLAGGTPPPVEAEIVAKAGTKVVIEVSGRLEFANGIPVGIFCIARDISQRKRSERLEHKRREVLEMIAQNQPLDAILHRLEEMVEHDYPGAEVHIKLENEAHRHAAAETRPGHLEIPIRACDGTVMGMIEVDHAPIAAVTDFDQVRFDSKAKLAAIALEHRQLTMRLAYQAHHDPLTSLPNRALLEDRLRQAISLARRQGNMVAVIYVDLDRFKFINDTLGHDVGDVLLQETAKRLESAVRESDTLARPGGDEFVAILPGIDTARDAEVVGERIIDAMRLPFQVMGHELFVSASVGLSIFPHDGEDAATLQRHADIAMYEAKNRGGNRFQKFACEMNSASQERLEIENHLHRALERGELQLYYQPQFQVLSGRLAGVEALLRWNHPKWGLVPPSRFVPVAEDSGLIIPISLWVLQEACRQHVVWRRAGYPPVRVAINISATQFMRTNLAAKVAQVLATYSMQPQYLELELTEGVLMRDVEDSARQIAQLRALGVRISIDDFGTGYSSLSYLQRLPIDDLKIDRCFVQGIGQSASTEALVKAIVGLAHGLQMTATAEGVETDKEMAVLRELGCDRVQGFLLGRPAPPEVWEAGWQSGKQNSIWDPDSSSDLQAPHRTLLRLSESPPSPSIELR